MSETITEESILRSEFIHSDLRDALPLWTVYRPSGDEGWRAVLTVRYPEPAQTNIVIRGDSRGDVRKQLPKGLTKLMRYPSDPVGVEETWA